LAWVTGAPGGTAMPEFWREATTSIVLLVALAATLVAVGVYVIGRLRQETVEKEPPASRLITNFQELHAKGELSDQEYRTIKAVLTERFQDELKETGEPG
jgi:uncharacterized membrane protein